MQRHGEGYGDAAGRITGAARDQIIAAAAEATVVACGPGLGRSDGLTALVAELYCDLEKPLVVDADGLNALAENVDALRAHAAPRRGAGGRRPRALTPAFAAAGDASAAAERKSACPKPP